MPISRRYRPEHPPEESCNFGMDFSFVLPPGIGISSGGLTIWTNTATPAPADADFTAGPVTVRGRSIYAMLSGGVSGRDYQLRWTANDTAGNVWARTALVLCAETS